VDSVGTWYRRRHSHSALSRLARLRGALEGLPPAARVGDTAVRGSLRSPGLRTVGSSSRITAT